MRSLRAVLAVAVALAACGSSGGGRGGPYVPPGDGGVDMASPVVDGGRKPDLAGPPGRDLSVEPDLSEPPPPPDMTLPPRDLVQPKGCNCNKPCMFMQCFGGCCIEDVLNNTCTPDPGCLNLG